MTENPTNIEPVERLSETWWAARSPEIRARRCSAHRRNGAQCAKVAMEAQQVCGTHGGRAPQSKRKARQRIDEAQDRMARILLGIAEGAESEAVKLAAVKHALAIGGLSEKHALAVEVEVTQAPWEELMGDVMAISRAQHQALQRGEMPATLPPADAGIVDAEVVDEPRVAPPSSTGDAPDAGDRVDGPPRRPAWAEDPPARPATGLVTLEEANAQLRDEARRRAENRRAANGSADQQPSRVSRGRRGRR